MLPLAPFIPYADDNKLNIAIDTWSLSMNNTSDRIFNIQYIKYALDSPSILRDLGRGKALATKLG